MLKSIAVVIAAVLITGCAAQSDFVPLSKAEQQAKINAIGATKSSTVRRALESNPDLMAKELVLCERYKPAGTQIRQVYCRTIELVNVEGDKTREFLSGR
jgi:hypothetical protein